MSYIKTAEAAEKWGMSDRRVRVLCEQGRIAGLRKEGQDYLIPEDTEKPVDGRSHQGSYIVPQEYAELFRRIDSKKAEINKHRPLSAGEARRLRLEFLTAYTYNSNAIEGNTLTLRETAMVLEGITIDKKPLKDHLEAIGHQDAFVYLEKLINRKSKFTERIIKEIHSLILLDKPEDKGVYRRIPVSIAGAFCQPPQPYLVPEQMEALLLEFNNHNMHPIQAAAMFHLRFEGVHPFIDGNGRTGRLILNFSLMKQGYPAIDVKYADRRRYYDCFDAYYRDGNPDPMIRMIAEYAEERLDMYLSVLKITD
jgi:Fic family protein